MQVIWLEGMFTAMHTSPGCTVMHTMHMLYLHLRTSPNANIRTHVNKIVECNDHLDSVVSKEAGHKLLVVIENTSESKNAEDIVDDS